MAAVALGGIAISKAVGAIRDNAEQAKKETELWLGVQEKVVAGQTREAMAGLAEEYDGTLDSLEELGYTAGDWVDAMRGQKDLVGDLSTRYEVLGSKLANAVDPAHALTEAELDEYNILSKLIPNLREQTENRDNAVIAMDEEKRRVDLLTSAYQGQQPVNLELINQYGRIIDRVEGVSEVMETAVDDGIDPMQQALDDLGVQYDKLMDKFDDREAVDKMNEALADLMITMADQESSWTDLRQKSDDYARSLADVIMSMEDVPTEVKSQLLAWVDQGQLDLVKGQLDAIAKTRTAEFQIFVEAVASAELKQMENRLNRDINGNGVIGRAAGGQVWPGGVFAVGDNADGSWNPTTELFVPNTAGRIMSAGDSRAALGGATYISVSVAVPTAVDRGAVGREIAEALLEYQSEAGPVFMTTRS
jgi:chromosome segregation ATPase